MPDVFPDSTHFWIEPLNEFEKDLIKLKEKYKGTYIIAATGKEKVKMTINVHAVLFELFQLSESDINKAEGKQRTIIIIQT